MAYKISPDLCVACGTCIDECPVEAISAGDVYVIDPDKCIDCGTCAGVCPSEAICRHARNPGPIHPYGLPPVRDSQQFSSRFQRQITIPPTVNSIRPEAPSKGISRKGRNTSDDSGGAVHHRTSKDTCTGILPQTNLSVCRIYLLYLIIEHRNIAGEAYPAMSNACFSP